MILLLISLFRSFSLHLPDQNSSYWFSICLRICYQSLPIAQVVNQVAWFVINKKLNAFMQILKHQFMSLFNMLLLSLIITLIVFLLILGRMESLRCSFFIREHLFLVEHLEWPSLWCTSILKNKQVSLCEHFHRFQRDESWRLRYFTTFILFKIKLFRALLLPISFVLHVFTRLILHPWVVFLILYESDIISGWFTTHLLSLLPDKVWLFIGKVLVCVLGTPCTYWSLIDTWMYFPLIKVLLV